MNAPLQLERHRILEINLKATEGRVEKFTIDTKTEVALAQNQEDPHRWRVILRVDLIAPKEGKASYTGRIVFEGFFRADSSLPEERIPKIIAVNGASILYGAARETIASLTARGPHPMVTLPAVSFFDVEVEKDTDKKSQGKRKKTSSAGIVR